MSKDHLQTRSYISHNDAIRFQTEAQWRAVLATVPPSQEKNIVGLIIWWEFLSMSRCTSLELPTFLAEYHMRYRSSPVAPNKAKTHALLLQLGFGTKFVEKKLEGLCFTFEKGPEEDEVMRQIFAEQVRTRWPEVVK